MYRDTWAQIRLDRIQNNIERIRRKSGKAFFAVIKANGYGLGDEILARTAMDSGASYLAVSCLEEALFLRERGIRSPILVLGMVPLHGIPLCIKEEITVTAASLSWIEALSSRPSGNLKVHLKFDTGMHRIGFSDVSQLSEGLKKLLSMGIRPEGIYSHYAASDEENLSFCRMQLQLFGEALKKLAYPFLWIHCSNTDGALFLKESMTNAVRCGIGMFGISSRPMGLLPALSLYSGIVHVQLVKRGESIGYGRAYIPSRDEWIGTLPIGYGDGWLRKNSGRTCFVEGRECPFVGKICMDMSMIRLTERVPPGTKVELIGDHMPIERVAKELETIPYEVMTLLGSRITRQYLEEDGRVHTLFGRGIPLPERGKEQTLRTSILL